MSKKTKRIASAFLVTAAIATTIFMVEFSQHHIIAAQNGINVTTFEKSAVITFPKPTGGITQIGIEHLDFSPDAFITMVTASGPTRDVAAMAVASLQTFTNLNQQSSFVDTKSITFAYNQTKPTYVISELERAKLISPLEAQAARAAFYSLQSQVGSKSTPVGTAR
jgi:hypothetical protein